jgi:hypothetical protein
MFASVVTRFDWGDHIPDDGGLPKGVAYYVNFLLLYFMSLWTLSSFGSLSATSILCFHHLTISFAKIPGGYATGQHSHNCSRRAPAKRRLAARNLLFPAFVYGTNIDAPYHLC